MVVVEEDEDVEAADVLVFANVVGLLGVVVGLAGDTGFVDDVGLLGVVVGFIGDIKFVEVVVGCPGDVWLLSDV